MGQVLLGTTMSLDGCINDRAGSVERLYPDLAAWRESAPGRDSIQNTGAANTASQCLQAKLADELHVDIVPVLLGRGLRLSEGFGGGPVQLERLKVVDLPGGRTHPGFRVIKEQK